MPFIFIAFLLCDGTSVQLFCCIIYLLTVVLVLSYFIMLSAYCLVADFFIITKYLVPRRADHRDTSTTSDMATETD